jgi:hypothetical protein
MVISNGFQRNVAEKDRSVLSIENLKKFPGGTCKIAVARGIFAADEGQGEA